MSARAALVVGALLAATTGCSTLTDLFTNSFVTNGFSGDPYPIYVDSASGGILVGLRTDDGHADRLAVVDLMSPITVLDPGPDAEPSEDSPYIYILGASAAEGELDTPRAELSEPTVFSLHQCDTPDCYVGSGDAPVVIDGLVGANALAGDAVRLRLADDDLFILADIAGDSFARTLACDAVMPSPFQGGGTLLVGGTEFDFSNFRPVIGACLAPIGDPEIQILQSQRGADAIFVISTSIGITLLGQSAYENYRLEQGGVPPDITALPMDSVNLPSGPIFGYHTTIPSLALVGQSGQTVRSPCRNVYANHLIGERECSPGDANDACNCGSNNTNPICLPPSYPITDEPCDSDHTCDAPAEIELQPPAGIDILVIDDADETLQALRAELRPSEPEIDGILGTNALRAIELDADYPHDRILGRCTDSTCATRPMITGNTARPDVQNCLANQPF